MNVVTYLFVCFGMRVFITLEGREGNSGGYVYSRKKGDFGIMPLRGLSPEIEGSTVYQFDQ